MGELLSPVEAILQNILGADNILVPPGSQVEEILQAIYYNTEYEKNPESRVAEILLAIKNKGVYDGPVLSRVEDILIHKLNNIPYTKHKKEDLSRVEQLLLDWLEQGGGEEIIEYTGTFPMTILANGEPLLDYLISGNEEHSGTPTPDNPIIPQGTGERTGNVMPAGEEKTVVSNGITFNSDGKGKYSISGTATAYASARFNLLSAFTTPISVSNGGQGTLSFFNTQSDNNVTFVFYNGTTKVDDWKQTPSNRASTAYNAIGNKYVNSIVITVNSGATVDITITPEFTNDGVIPESFEKYGYKIPISSANATTPIYLGEVETTRKIKKLVFDGRENVSYNARNDTVGRWVVTIPTANGTTTPENVICTHFNTVDSTTKPLAEGGICMRSTGVDVVVGGLYTDIGIIAPSDSTTIVNAVKAYLAAQYAAGTPVCVWYVLATPETAVVNEPLMRIGGYADTLSYAQAGVEIPTNKKPTETVVDIPTSVKPSEGYIKYTEPTDGPTPKTQVLGTKDHKIYMTSNDEVYVLRR